MHTSKKRRLPDLTRAAEELRSRITNQTRSGLGRELDEVSRRRQKLCEIGGRIV
jgi:hypothetical protein